MAKYEGITQNATLTLKNLHEIGAVAAVEGARCACGDTQDLWNVGLHHADQTNPGMVCGGDAFLADKTMEDFIPALDYIKYKGTIKIPVYGNYNQYFVLGPGESMKVEPKTDAEALFYLGMAQDGVLEVKNA